MNDVSEWRTAPAAEFAVIGDPVGHSLSPLMHSAAFRELGLDHRYVAVRVAHPDEVAPAIRHLKSIGYRGVNVTVPHKEAALAGCSPDAFSTSVRAVNTIDLLGGRGTNTDAPGFMHTLREVGIVDGSVLLLGAGGSARALVLALHEAGFKVSLFNRTRERAKEMVAGLGIAATILDEPDPLNADLIVNTTSASLHGDRLEIDWTRAPSGAVAYDLMYSNLGTPFLREASARGLRTVDGLPLLVAQGALSLEYWLGVEAPRQAMMEAVRCA